MLDVYRVCKADADVRMCPPGIASSQKWRTRDAANSVITVADVADGWGHAVDASADILI